MKTIVIACLLFSLTTMAYAFKPKTHVYLAEIAIEDALDDGKVTIHYVDYEGKKIVGAIGEYPVSSEVLYALRNHAAQYRAGVLGPDAYPDIFTGQQAIHPKYAGKWFEYLWSRAQSADPAAKAFVLGYMTHGAGDMFGHTFINHFSGGPFSFAEYNAVKHFVVESCVANRNPPLKTYNASIAGVEDFIYQTLINAHPDSHLRKYLLKGEGTDLSLPLYASKTKSWLERYIQDYSNWIQKRNEEIDGLKKKNQREREKIIPDIFAITSRLAEIGVLEADKSTFINARIHAVNYAREWIKDIDRGLKVWPKVSHEIATALMFDPSGTNLEKAKKVAQDFLLDHYLSMIGAPDVVGDVIQEALKQIAALIEFIMEKVPALKVILAELEKIKNDFLNYLCKKAFGMSAEEYSKYLKSPETYFNDVIHLGQGSARPTLGEFYKNYLHLAKSSDYFDWQKFAPAYNTVTISKLILLDQSTINQLLQDLGTYRRLTTANIMLGFIENLDADNQWACCTSKMVFAQDMEFYQRIFMFQAGETKINVPVQDSLDLNQFFAGKFIYKANSKIKAGGGFIIKEQKKVVFKAPEIEFTPGFEVQPGSELSADQ
ncbi:hypothetical protein UABAM_04564 [Candidatus Uabimicrobium amorphum]|uniref:Phospholipase C/D domain-containing protein n=1 Tax=Uabimicrobium amorphum TaxID=2596890 RepID=A0A5S9IQE3_UABAM|nr:zinc dependent phospholipase C family protein [Candidatus Uabimicrobium amorphum]BBM86178.1 hypothetical protein UABAM_04564 [Candidatus Uabimicrobium amorphum]